MRVTDKRSVVVASVGLLCLAVFLSATASPPRPQSAASARVIALAIDPAQSTVHYTLDSTLHTVHGTFALKQGSLHFDPSTGKAGGEIVVLATSGESGNSSRDAKMHKDVLESSKYPDVIFRPTRVEGTVALSGSSDVQIRGVFSLHGSNHEMVVPVHAELTGRAWKGTSKFDVPFIDWGLKDPSNFFLHVKHIVGIELQLAGSLSNSN